MRSFGCAFFMGAAERVGGGAAEALWRQGRVEGVWILRLRCSTPANQVPFAGDPGFPPQRIKFHSLGTPAALRSE